MTQRRPAAPPPSAVAWLTRVLPAHDANDIIGDLIQVFADRTDEGRRGNALWFWMQTTMFTLFSWLPDRGPDRHGSSLMDRITARLREAVRHLRHDWTYAIGVVLILAAGLGPAAAMISVIDTVLLRPLAYADPDRIAMVRIDIDTLRGHPGLGPDEVRDLREAGLFDAVEMQRRLAEVTMAVDDELVPLSQIGITPGTLRMLGVRPALGRDLRDEDLPAPPAPGAAPPAARTPTGPPPQVGLLDYDTWQTRFGGTDDVLGRTIRLDGQTTEIVGVTPRGFRLATGRSVPRRVDVYTPITLPNIRNAWQFPTLARLKTDATYASTQERLDALAASLRTQYPDIYPGTLRFTITPVLDDMTAATRPALRAALAAVLLLLLIAIVNAAALIVARLRTRQHDFAVRQALGAGRGALAGQVLAESALLGLAATIAGALLAAATMAGVREVMPRTVPRWDELTISWELMAWAGAFAFGGLAVTGLALVRRVTRTSATPALRAGSAQGGRSEGGTSRLMLAGAQMAVTVVLAFGCLQLARSADALGRVDLGFDPDVMTLRVGYDFRTFNSRAARADLYTRVRDRVAQVPGVTAVGVATHVPLSGSTMMDGYEADLSKEPSFAQAANYQAVTTGYFDAARIPIVQGRDFTAAEVTSTQPVVVVDETLVRTVFPGESDVIGRELRLGWGLENARIVGVVGHVRAIEIGREVRPQIYSTVGNLFQVQNGGIVTVRTSGDAMALRPAIEAAIREVGTGRAIGQVAMLSDNVEAALSTLRAVTGLVTVLALVAVGLSAAGLYIGIAYLVYAQRRSAAIRTALGATRKQVLFSFLHTGSVVLLVSIAVGLVGAAAGAGLIQDLLYGVTPRDVASLLIAAGVTVFVSATAMYLPARRAARANVVKVLRES